MRRRPVALVNGVALVGGPMLAIGLAIGLALVLPTPVLAAAQQGAPGKVGLGVAQAALIALGYYLANSPWLFGLAFFTLFRPLVAGFFVGLILGDPGQGTLIGAAINLAYLGFISAGGSLPGDPSLAGWIGVAVALAGHLSPGQALALAVPIGLLGTLIFNVRMTVDSIFAHWADARAEAADISGVALMNWLPGQSLLFVISFVPVFVMALNGTDFVNGILAGLPAWALNGLAIAGGVLPAIGIALNMRFIFRGQARPYFFLGYILLVATAGGLSMVLVAALGLVLAFLHLTFVTEGAVTQVGRGPVAAAGVATAGVAPAGVAPAGVAAAGVATAGVAPAGVAPAGVAPAGVAPAGVAAELPPAEVTPAEARSSPGDRTGDRLTAAQSRAVGITRGDLIRSWVLWTFFAHANYSYERLQGTGFAHAMTPIIRRLYHTDDEIRAALKRHLVFFNTEPNLGNITHGAIIAMEEQRANGAPIDDDAINSVKSGLMGPLAGIGDTISQGTLTPIFLAIGIGIAGASPSAGQNTAGETGNPLGAIVYIALIAISIVAIGYTAWMQGYARGRSFVTDILRSGTIERLLTGAGVLGNLVLGALAAKTIVVFVAPTLNVGQGINLQTDVLDQLAPGILPLALVMLTWWLLGRRVSALTILAVFLVLSIAAAYPFFGRGPSNANDFSYGACTSSLLHPYTACAKPSPAPSGAQAAPSPAASPSAAPSPSASGASGAGASPSPSATSS